MIRKIKKVLLPLLFILAIIIVAYQYHTQFEYKKLNPGGKPSSPKVIAVTAHGPQAQISANTNVVQKTTYLRCNDEQIFNGKPAANMIGMDQKQLRQTYSEWTIDKFDPHDLQMSIRIDTLCREHASNLYLGISDGFVVIFHGTPVMKPIVKEPTKIRAAELAPEEVEKLRRGLPIAFYEEAMTMIRNYKMPAS